MTSAQLFAQASATFIGVVEQIRADQWEAPGLGSWDVRGLVGHTARAILTVQNYLGLEEPGQVSIATAEEYYARIYSEYTDPAAVAARGVEAGKWLGSDPAAMIRTTDASTRELIAVQHPGRLVSFGGLGIPFEEYLRTRVFELVTHTLDIARATGVAVRIPAAPLAHTVALATAIATNTGHGEEVLLALTGRVPLPEGFSVV